MDHHSKIEAKRLALADEERKRRKERLVTVCSLFRMEISAPLAYSAMLCFYHTVS